MNDTFSLKRFWNYFLYDLNNAKNRYGLSLVIVGFSAIILFVLSSVFSLIGGDGIATTGSGINITASVIAMVITTIMFPVKVYGDITERKYGSSWLMIPASGFEKFLSMALIVCVVLPACLFGLLTLGNVIVSFFVPDCGVVPKLYTVFTRQSDVFSNIGLMCWLEWSENILAFTLGALCFKTGKTGKTILCLFAFGILVMFAILLVFGGVGINEETIERIMDSMTAEKAQFLVNAVMNATNALLMGGLLAGIYFRIKNMKH